MDARARGCPASSSRRSRMAASRRRRRRRRRRRSRCRSASCSSAPARSCADSSSASSTRRIGGARSAVRSSRSSSTGSARDRALNEQDGLYTLVDSGHGRRRRDASDYRIVALAEPRAVGARRSGTRCSRCARDPEIELVISNTTEVGIALDERDAFDASSAALVSRQAHAIPRSSARARSTTTPHAGSSCSRAS